VLPVVTGGMMEPSAIRRFSIPWTLRLQLTTDMASRPIFAAHVCASSSWLHGERNSSSAPFKFPGITSRSANGRSADARRNLRGRCQSELAQELQLIEVDMVLDDEFTLESPKV
jgi:hypothetical protein